MEHMKNVRSLTVAALLVALAVTLKFLKIVITPTLEFSFAFLANASAGFYSGPLSLVPSVRLRMCWAIWSVRPAPSFRALR